MKSTIKPQRANELRGITKFVFLGNETHGSFVILSEPTSRQLATILNQAEFPNYRKLTKAKPISQSFKITNTQVAAIEELKTIIDNHEVFGVDLQVGLGEIKGFNPNEFPRSTKASKTVAHKFYQIMSTLTGATGNGNKWIWRGEDPNWYNRETLTRLTRVIATKANKERLAERLRKIESKNETRPKVRL